MIRHHQVHKLFILLITLFFGLLAPLSTKAEVKFITSEATYAMGDGESPSFAETMVLQKAKQMALEQAGTYIESYTKIRNYDLTEEEIQTIAGGVLQVEVLEKNRTLIGDGLKFYIRIKATVTTDKMEELAQRVKGKNIAPEYKRLQADYATLSQEIENWKQLVAKAPSGPERETALNHIREHEITFAETQKAESVLFQRLISGEQIVSAAIDEQTEVDRLVKNITKTGHVITVGKARAKAIAGKNDYLLLVIPIRLKIASALIPAMSEATKSLAGVIMSDTKVILNEYGPGIRAGLQNFHRPLLSLVRISEDQHTAEYFQDMINDLVFSLQLATPMEDIGYCILGRIPSLEAKRNKQGQLTEGESHLIVTKEDHEWHPIRRIFPIGEIELDPLFGNRVSSYLKYYSSFFQTAKRECLGYVAIAHDEAQFTIVLEVPRSSLADLKEIRARIIKLDHTKDLKGQEYQCNIAP